MRLFVSYSRTNKEVIDRLVRFLKAADYDVWLDREKIKPTEAWRERIREAIHHSDGVILCGSPGWCSSEFCPWEYELALKYGKPLVPVLIAPDTRLPDVFVSRQFIDFSQKIDLNNAGRLIAALRAFEYQIASNPVPSIIGTLFEWINIPAGEVTLTDSSHYQPDGYPHFGTQGGRQKVAPFAIARYPITNAQFDGFVYADDGYCDPQWWNFSGQAMIWRTTLGKGDKPLAPQFAGDDLPRTNVAWYDAIAYCRWLSFRSGETITLPTEAEWQWAAQGSDGRQYTWGMMFDETCCNYVEVSDTRRFALTPVTHYPQGASPFGVMDMCGNAWEWTLSGFRTPGGSLYSEVTDDIAQNVWRVARGGSGRRARNEQHKLSVTYRLEVDDPATRSQSRGFRIVRRGL
jgi:formylglycine-generating enzyme required for sulfatase activity